MQKISVIISAYNEEKYIGDCLTALQQQTYPHDHYNIYVIDNNSTDKTAAIAQSFGATVITEKKQGYIFSLNTGLKSGDGDIVAVTDADSIVPPHWLAEIAKSFEDESVVGLSGGVVLDGTRTIMSTVLVPVFNAFLHINYMLGKPHFMGPNMAIRKSAFQKIKEIDTRYRISGDVALGLALKPYGKIKYISNLQVRTSARRFQKNPSKMLKDMNKYLHAYFSVIWFNKPPKTLLTPVR